MYIEIADIYFIVFGNLLKIYEKKNSEVNIFHNIYPLFYNHGLINTSHDH